MKNLYGIEIKPYQWQKEVQNHKDVLIIAPTGAGKSIAAYNWVFKEDSETKPTKSEIRRVIFTAPTKALSNERFLELKRMGKNAGIITGDVRYNQEAEILCMTQEIYNNEFALFPYQKVVIDEIHYLFQDGKRARAYIDGIVNTNTKSDLMLLSATINTDAVNYFEKISGRKFHLIHIKKRPVPVKYIGRVSYKEILKNYSPAIIFLFSRKGVESVAEEVYSISEDIPIEKQEKLKDLCKRLNIQSSWLIKLARKGVAVYSGNMLFKEKIFAEQLIRKGIAKVIVGTDALALGVNFPVKSVIFGQLAKYYDGPITKREFLQMSGRAGRPNLHNTGYVGFTETGYESFEFDTEELYEEILKKPLEKETLLLEPDYSKIFLQMNYLQLKEMKKSDLKKIIEKEIEYIRNYSFGNFGNSEDLEDSEDFEMNLSYYLNEIKRDFWNVINFLSQRIKSEKVFNILQRIYFQEFSIIQNLIAAEKLFSDSSLDAFEFFRKTAKESSQREMLQYLKFYNKLKNSGFKINNLENFKQTIENIDEFVLYPEKLDFFESNEKINEKSVKSIKK